MKRSGFLKLVSAIGSMLVGLIVGIPATVTFLSPVFRRGRTEAWVALGEAEFFDWGVPIRVDFPQTVQDAWVESRVIRSVWLYTVDGEDFTVYNGRCTHLACQFAWDEQSDLTFHPESEVFHCPCHHAIFRLTGEVIRGPAPRPLDTLEWKVEGGILYARYEDYRPGISDKVPV